MGYFLLSRKMIYKAEYGPFNVLCPVTYEYVPYE